MDTTASVIFANVATVAGHITVVTVVFPLSVAVIVLAAFIA
jgi:acyl-[acyl carrier protein]--UDP-N-acetylglucosamine O-acyltransferase